jgi:hypothetical protein
MCVTMHGCLLPVITSLVVHWLMIWLPPAAECKLLKLLRLPPPDAPILRVPHVVGCDSGGRRRHVCIIQCASSSVQGLVTASETGESHSVQQLRAAVHLLCIIGGRPHPPSPSPHHVKCAASACLAAASCCEAAGPHAAAVLVYIPQVWSARSPCIEHSGVAVRLQKAFRFRRTSTAASVNEEWK